MHTQCCVDLYNLFPLLLQTDPGRESKQWGQHMHRGIFESLLLVGPLDTSDVEHDPGSPIQRHLHGTLRFRQVSAQ